ncbi:MAG: NADH-quinone oxidoreductase subunit L [Caedibacter sp. 38-128]|nr:NADH-quinone oxidoreductase subunit L [Holosporales bacterium]OJX03536.1 MAG: NADH-quinone oxidoreductase subunit L [Caedibacter sp. 38-128]
MIEYLSIFCPLLGFVSSGLLGRRLSKHAINWMSCIIIMIGSIASLALAWKLYHNGKIISLSLFPWFDVGNFQVCWGLYFDHLSVTMVLLVNIISFLVHVYSVGYMSQDPHSSRFMSYLSLFTFMMLVLVTSDNLVQLFFGWEGVGLTSYLLIGFWYERESANQAAFKAFLVNRIGDLGFIIGIAATFLIFKTLEFDQLFQLIHLKEGHNFNFFGYEFSKIEILGFLFFIGAMGKSAQIGLHTWLPDAMEGPTPVSALIHAATMVTAGVFLLIRLSPLYELAPYARDFVALVGGITAVFAGSIAITQNDIKRVIAYSTCSQLGYMFMAIGLSAYNGALFHLITHAFFKALLFLGAGAVIHALSDEQDMQHMGGLRRSIPVTYTVMIIGSLALCGIPFFAGYFSKDYILEIALLNSSWVGQVVYFLGISAAVLTAFYSWRLLFLTFHGQSRANELVMSHIHEPGYSMLLPLFVLVFGSIFGGYLGEVFFLNEKFWGGSIPIQNLNHLHLNFFLKHLPTIAAFIGLGLAIYLYLIRPQLPVLIVQRFKKVYLFLYNKWFFDELYSRLFLHNTLKGAHVLWLSTDQKIIDGYGPEGFASVVYRMAKRASQLQTGYIYHYVLALVGGLCFLILLLLLKQ